MPVDRGGAVLPDLRVNRAARSVTPAAWAGDCSSTVFLTSCTVPRNMPGCCVSSAMRQGSRCRYPLLQSRRRLVRFPDGSWIRNLQDAGCVARFCCMATSWRSWIHLRTRSAGRPAEGAHRSRGLVLQQAVPYGLVAAISRQALSSRREAARCLWSLAHHDLPRGLAGVARARRSARY